MIENLEYVSRSGKTAGVGHSSDDPYLGNPKSARGHDVMREGPTGLAWTAGGRRIEKHFEVRIQAAFDSRSNTIVVIGHWGASICDSGEKKCGVVLGADGSLIRDVQLPPSVSNVELNKCEVPESLTVVKSIADGVEIWISHDDGRWHERRIYFPESGIWGNVLGQYKSG